MEVMSEVPIVRIGRFKCTGFGRYRLARADLHLETESAAESRVIDTALSEALNGGENPSTITVAR
jgi:hypothetical protein